MVPRVHVIVAGAGPAGLLTAIKLLRRNADTNRAVKYTVELVEHGEDYGALDEVGLQKKRSWMIGLSAHGLGAIRSVPGLFTDYVEKVGVHISGACINIGKSKFGAKDDIGENYVIDRNFVVAAIASYLNDHFKDSGSLTLRYKTRVNFVDGDKKQIHVSSADGSEKYLPYDLLIGCDGVRSAVRSAMVMQERDMECSISSIFNHFKSVHIPLPEGIPGDVVQVLPGCMPYFNGIGLPETGGKINIALGYQTDKVKLVDESCFSEDPAVVTEFFRRHFKAFPLPVVECAEQWVKQPWNTTSQVHCSTYHSSKMSAVLMGDAAHATSPAIGQGMNTALDDALAFDLLLDEHEDNLKVVLPEYSNLRVKEGNALSALSFYAYPLSPSLAIYTQLCSMLRVVLNKYLPFLVSPEPMQQIPRGGRLSKAYNDLTKLGRLPMVRKSTEELSRKHFETTTGMVLPDSSSSGRGWLALSAVALMAVAAFVRRLSA